MQRIRACQLQVGDIFKKNGHTYQVTSIGSTINFKSIEYENCKSVYSRFFMNTKMVVEILNRTIPNYIIEPEVIADKLAAFLSVRKEVLRRSYRGNSGGDKRFYRHLYVYLLHQYSGMNKAEIGNYLGVDRTICYNSLDTIAAVCKENGFIRNQVIKLEEMFESYQQAA